GDDALLDRRHALDVHLHAEIAARHHHRVGRGDDRVEMLYRLRRLDLDDDVGRAVPRLELAPQPGDVFRAAHERQRHEIDVAGVVRGPVEIVQILVGQRADREIAARKVQTLPRTRVAGERDAQPGPAGRALHYRHRDGAVRKQHRLTDGEVVGQLAIGAGELYRGRGRAGDQRELVIHPAVENIAGDRLEPHLRTAQVLQHADVAIHLAADSADRREDGAVFLVRAVREIETEHVDAGGDELAQHGRF